MQLFSFMPKNYFFFLLIFFLLTSCLSNDKKVIVDFNGPSPTATEISFHQDEAIHVGIASIISPKESFDYYNELLAYISQRIGMSVHYIQKESYQEINDLLTQNIVDFAFIGTGGYVDAKKKKIARLLVAPVSNGKSTFKAFIVVNKYSHIKSFRDLQGKNFAFTDPYSHTGFNFIISKIKKLGLNENKYFSKTIFTYSHDLSCELVNRGVMDAASVSSLVFDYLKQKSPAKVKNLKIIEESYAFPSPPVVVSAGLDEKKYKLYKNIFLNLHKDPTGKAILNKLNIDSYVNIQDSDYNDVRELSKMVSK